MLLDNTVLAVLRLLMLPFAVASLTDLLVWQKIMQPIRELAGIDHDENGNRMGHNDSFFARALWCFRCTTVWSSIFLVLLWFSFPRAYDFLSLILYASILAHVFYENS